MDLLVNDLSVHEQFSGVGNFREALSRLMTMRMAARRFGREVQCHRALLNAKPVFGMSMRQAIGRLEKESERRAAMIWLTRGGPFWDDMRQHGRDEWLECAAEVVTDTAVGEAAFRTLHGIESGLISLSPSNWNFQPLEAIWRRETEELEDRKTTLQNWWCTKTLEDGLRARTLPIGSWSDLSAAAARRYVNLTFTENCFSPLMGIPFAKSGAERFLVLLDILDRLARAFENDQTRSAEGHRIYRDHFTGDRALFSDSSDSEKRDFCQQLTFAHPEDQGETLFCTWHGKVSRLTLRLHFSWPIKAGKPVYVVYAGPKITKR